MSSSESHDIYKLTLSDKLNLTGRVTRTGKHAAISGGCANVWEGEFEGEKVAVKVVREVGTRSSIYPWRCLDSLVLDEFLY